MDLISATVTPDSLAYPIARESAFQRNADGALALWCERRGTSERLSVSDYQRTVGTVQPEADESGGCLPHDLPPFGGSRNGDANQLHTLRATDITEYLHNGQAGDRAANG